MQYLLFQKALRTKQFSSDTKQDDPSKEKDPKNKDQEADINNLMTVDTDGVLELSWAVNNFFISLISISLIIYFLYAQLHDAVLNGIYVIVVAMFVGSAIVFLMILGYKLILQHKDRRISLSTDVIEGMKSIKYMSWEGVFEKKILILRHKEFLMILLLRVSSGLSSIFWTVIRYLFL